MKLEIVHLRGREEDTAADAMLKLVEHGLSWQRPQFPIQGKDLIAQGMEAGAAMGKKLKQLEEIWVESGFELGREDLLNLQDDQ